MVETKIDQTSTWLEPVQVQTTDIIVLDALTSYVAKAGIQIGDRLPPERVLVERLRVSRATVREALKRWEALGIIERRKGSGTFLKADIAHGDSFLSVKIKSNAEDILHTLEIRRTLESEASALAAMRATDEQIAKIQQCIEEVERVHAIYGGAGAQDWEFHSSIYHATGNPLFEQIVEGMYEAFHTFFEAPPEQQFASSSLHLHRELFEAIKARNPELARQKTHEILDITERDVRKILLERTA